MDIHCNYGILHDCSGVEYFSDHSVKGCIVNKRSELVIQGKTIPLQYDHEGVRRKYIPSVYFYPGGQLYHIALQEPTMFSTLLQDIPAEFITFYESGAIKRIFPRNGRISAYWSEQEELKLLEPLQFSFYFGTFTAKIIAIHFFESGRVYSITLAPQEQIMVWTPGGTIPVRVGIALTEEGLLKSVEPGPKAIVRTPIGNVLAFDTECTGIHGDINSLCFEGDCVKSVKSLSVFTVQTAQKKISVEPYQYVSPLNDRIVLKASTNVFFEDNKVIFKRKDRVLSFSIKNNKFDVAG